MSLSQYKDVHVWASDHLGLLSGTLYRKKLLSFVVSFDPLGLLSGPLYRKKMLSLVVLFTQGNTSSKTKRIFYVPLRLNKPAMCQWALRDYCLAPCTGKNCCQGHFGSP